MYDTNAIVADPTFSILKTDRMSATYAVARDGVE